MAKNQRHKQTPKGVAEKVKMTALFAAPFGVVSVKSPSRAYLRPPAKLVVLTGVVRCGNTPSSVGRRKKSGAAIKSGALHASRKKKWRKIYHKRQNSET